MLAVMLIAAPGRDAAAQTLSETVATTYQSHPTIAAALDELRADDEKLAQAYQYWWRPEVSGTLEYGQEHIDSDTDEQLASGGVAISDYTEEDIVQQAEVTATLYLWRGGQTSAAIDNARATVEAQEATFESTVQSTLSKAAQANANVVLQAATLNLAYEHETDLRAIKDTVGDLLHARQATTVDVAQVELAVIEAQSTRADALGELEAARSSFNASTRSYPTELQHWPPLPALPDTLDQALEIARVESPNIRVAQAEVLANEAAVREDEGALLPTLSVVGDYTLEIDHARFQHSTDRAEYSRTGTASLMLELSIQLYTGGSGYSAVRESKRLVSQSRNKLVAAERTVTDNVTAVWQRLEAAERQIEIGHAQWSAAADALSGQEKQFEQGLPTAASHSHPREPS